MRTAEQLINFPTRDGNIPDLLITTTPDQFKNIESPDKFSDHDAIMGTFTCFKPYKEPKRMFLLNSKDDYNKVRKDISDFSKDKYFNGYKNSRSLEENWTLLKEAIYESIKKHIH